MQSLKRALELDPNSASAHFFSALVPLFRGELKEGLRLVLEAKKLDPVSPITSYVATAAYLANDQIDDAISEGQRTLLLDPNYFYLDSDLAAAYREKGNFAAAIALYTKSQETTHLPSSGLAITYTRMGRQVEARNILAQLLQAREKRYVSAPVIAAVYVALGDKEEAFHWLERAFAEHSGILQWIAFLPEFRPLHSDARFPHLLRRIGVSQNSILAITETTLSEINDPNALSHLTLKVGVKPRPGTQNRACRDYRLLLRSDKDNKMKPTDARTSYSWLNASEDWTDATPKFLVATYVRPRPKSLRLRDGAMADSLSMSISMANYKMPGRIRRNCSRSFQLQITSLFLRMPPLLRLISLLQRKPTRLHRAITRHFIRESPVKLDLLRSRYSAKPGKILREEV